MVSAYQLAWENIRELLAVALLRIPGFLPELALQALAPAAAGSGAALAPHGGMHGLQAGLLIEVAGNGVAG
jgi:hypothetical protein